MPDGHRPAHPRRPAQPKPQLVFSDPPRRRLRDDGSAFIGVNIETKYNFPVNVKIKLDNQKQKSLNNLKNQASLEAINEKQQIQANITKNNFFLDGTLNTSLLKIKNTNKNSKLLNFKLNF